MVRRFFVTCGVFTRYFFVAFSWLFRGFFVVFSWLFRGPRFGQDLRVLALEQSSEMASAKMASAIDVRIDDVGSILKFRIGFPFWREFCWVLPVRVASGADTEFPYRVRIVDRGVDCRDPVCRHRFRFPDRGWIWHTPVFFQRPPNPLKLVFWGLWTGNRGAPNTPNPTNDRSNPPFSALGIKKASKLPRICCPCRTHKNLRKYGVYTKRTKEFLPLQQPQKSKKQRKGGRGSGSTSRRIAAIPRRTSI